MADENEDPKAKDAEKLNLARRRLLSNAIYIPPAIIGVVSLLDGCAPGSCAPATCAPVKGCHPSGA